MARCHPLRVCPEVVIAERLQPGEQLVNFHLLRDEGGEGGFISAGGAAGHDLVSSGELHRFHVTRIAQSPGHIK